MDWIKQHANDLLPIVIAIIVPLAGLLLAAQEWLTGERTRSVRILAACVLGTCLWAIALTA